MVSLAQKAVIVHGPQAWPTGTFCRNCHAHWPCRLHRWGRAVLATAGWTESAIAELVERAAAGAVPWKTTAESGPSPSFALEAHDDHDQGGFGDQRQP